MKKTLLTLVLAATFAASAEWERIGSVQIARTDDLVAAATRLGAMMNNPMVGSLMAAQIAENAPFAEKFGPMRPNTSLLVPLYVDGAKLAAADDLEDAVACGVLLPVTAGREKYLAGHPGAVETNGCIRSEGDCIVFSADQKWLGFGDTPELARAAVRETAAAEKPMKGDLLRLRLEGKGMDLVVAAATREMAKKTNAVERAQFGQLLALVKDVKGAVLAVRLTEGGLDFRASYSAAEGSPLAALGTKPLAGVPLAFAATNAWFAQEHAVDFGVWQARETWQTLSGALEKAGFKPDFVKVVQAEDVTTFAVDPAAAIRAGAAFFEKDDEAATRLGENAASAFKKTNSTFALKGPAEKMQVTFAGYAAPATPAARFAATFPDLKGKAFASAQVYSLYGLIRILGPHILATQDEAEVLPLKMMLAQLPPEGVAGVGTAFWIEKGRGHALLRLSPDEIKGLGSLANLVVAQVFAGAAKCPSEDDDAGDDDFPSDED